MFQHISNFFNFTRMKVTIEAVVLEATKAKIKKFEDGKQIELDGQELEVKPDEMIGQTLKVKVFDLQFKFDQYRKYVFIGVLNNFVNRDKLYTTLNVEKVYPAKA